MPIALSLVVIRSADLERSMRFYEALGVQSTQERHGSGLEYLAAELGGVVFELYPRGTGPASSGVRIGFKVPSLAASVAALQKLDAEVATPPSQRPWGSRPVVLDPDGLRVELSQANEA